MEITFCEFNGSPFKFFETMKLFPTEKNQELFLIFNWGKVIFEFYAYPFVFFRQCKIGKILTTVPCILQKLYFLNLGRGAKLGRSRLVYCLSRKVLLSSKSSNILWYLFPLIRFRWLFSYCSNCEAWYYGTENFWQKTAAILFNNKMPAEQLELYSPP